MEPIGDALKRVVRAPNFAERYDAMRKEVMANPSVQQFLEEHSASITQKTIERSMGKLYEYINASHSCARCSSLENCINIMAGLEPKLILKGDLIDLEYVKCPSKLVEEERRNVSNMIESMHMPKDVMEARLRDIDIFYDDSRVHAVRQAKNFLNYIEKEGKLPERGLYIHGPFGIGKSFVLGALANELAEKKIRTVAVYVPEFLREMKQSIQDQTLNEKVNFVKAAPVLMLDDFGAETMSSWTRDEVLGTILQYRMSEQLPTFFTSNFNYEELEHHLTFTNRGDQESVKAARLMERVRTVSTSVRLNGANRRH